MEKSTSSVTPLNGTNYVTWKIQVKMLLTKDELYKIVDGTETAPTEEEALRKFQIRKDRALAMIVLTIDPKLLYIIGDPEEPSVVWTKLRDTFQKKTWANKLRLKRKLYAMKLEASRNLQEHLRTFIQIFDELAVIGAALEEEDKVINLLASLTDAYATLFTALEASEKVPTWETVVEKLFHEEEKVKSKSKETIGENKTLYSKNTKKIPPKCYECSQVGHIRRNCHQFLDKTRKRPDLRNDSRQKANTAVKKSEEDSDEETTLYASGFSASNQNHGQDLWIIDSGASQHM